MMNSRYPWMVAVKLFSCIVTVLLVGCGDSTNNSDLVTYIAEIKSQPAVQIEPLPPFRPYKSFTYSATSLRGPFDIPVKVQNLPVKSVVTNVKPDFNRPKEFLEEFPFGNLAMVGTISQNEELWVLISAGDAGIFRVKAGNFLGKNHGKIVTASETQVDVVEIVPNGVDGWIERPRTLKLQGQ